MDNKLSNKVYHAAIALFVLAAILSLASAAMAGLWHNPSRPRAALVTHKEEGACGLPAYLFSLRPDFSAQICPDAAQKFSPSEPRALVLTEISMSEAGADSSQTDFFPGGQPQFFRSDPPSYGEIIEYTADKKQVLEIVVSEPDSLAYLWDIEARKVYAVSQCGTACSLQGAFWLSSSRFVIYGSEELDGPNRKFVRFYDLSQKLSEEYLAN